MADAPRGAVDQRGLEVLLGQLSDAVAFVDRDGAILLTNRAEELPATPPTPQIADLGQASEIFHPDGRRYETAESPVLRSIRTGEAISGEAITNARRHSGATLIRVDAGGSTWKLLRLVIRDDGRWPNREFVLSSRPGAGITGMLERAELVGATLVFAGGTRGGTEVSLELVLVRGGTDGCERARALPG